jgi:hypothetical protein
MRSQLHTVRFVDGERYGISYQVTILEALPVLIGALKRSLRAGRTPTKLLRPRTPRRPRS